MKPENILQMDEKEKSVKYGDLSFEAKT